MNVERAYLAAGARTPFGRRNGGLADEHPAGLLATVMVQAVQRAGVPAEDVEQVIVGCVSKTGDQANNVARTAWLSAGLPYSVPGITIDAKCGSSQQAVHYAAGLVSSGALDVVVCGGLEHMTSHPLGQDVGEEMGDPYNAAYRRRYEITSQGESAERIAERWSLDRTQCDEIALASQERAALAVAARRLADEIVPVSEVRCDEGIRTSTMESLGGLRPVFRDDGVLTAGNSSQISDGASCVVVVSESYVRSRHLPVLAEIEYQAIVGSDPVLKLTGVIDATERILARSGLNVDDFGVVEINEAFASVLGAWLKEFGVGLPRVNALGGAIALGHPVAATGTRLLLSAAHQLQFGAHERALVAMCCGGGLGTASVLRRVS